MKFNNLYDITIQQMETCIYAARTGSFTAVSQALFMTQSAVSKQIRSIENSTGIVIFTRGRGTTLTLTPAGKVLIDYWQTIVKEYNHALIKADEAQNLNKNVFVVSTTPSSNTEVFLLPVIEMFEKSHPEITVRLELTSPEEAKTALTKGRSNVVICNSFKKDLYMGNEFDMVDLIHCPWCIGMKKDNLLAARTKLAWRDLRNQGFIAVNDYVFVKMLNGLCDENGGFTPNIVFMNPTFYGMADNVRDNKTVFLTDKFISDYYKPGFKFFEMDNSESGVIMITKKNDPDKFVGEFARCMVSYVAENNLSNIKFLE